MENANPLPTRLMVAISLLQGLCLLFLHQAIELHHWPHAQTQWLFALYGVAIIWPTMLLLGLNHSNGAAIVKLTFPFALLGGLLGFYTGYQTSPIEKIGYGTMLFSFVVTMAIATFKALMYSQQLASGKRVTYSALFLWSWRNFLTLALALLFAGSFWLVLVLWGTLFDAIGITFFQELFQERWFYYPAIALANGFGVIIFRNLTRIIDTITRLQQALMKFLLLMLSLVSLLFLAALPFTGLAPLWEGGGSSLILWMQALMLFFVNAVYQDEPDQRPYPLWLHRFIYVSVAVLPIYSMISFYGLSLRVDQYGWTLSRYWAFLIWFLLALFPLGYWWGIAKYRDGWVHQLSKVNVALGLVVLAMMVLVNSPLLDFRKMVAANQLQRLADNEVTLADFDYRYFLHNLARPGYEGLELIKAQYGEANPGIVVKVDALFEHPYRYSRDIDSELSTTRDEFVATLTVLSGNPPEALLTTLYEERKVNSWRAEKAQEQYLRALDVDADGKTEYIRVVKLQNRGVITLYFEEDDRWQSSSVTDYWSVEDDWEQIYQAFAAGEIEVVTPRWKDIAVGDKKFSVQQRRRQRTKSTQ